MIRYLKYIFLVFALLAIGVSSFFFLNNKKDILVAFEIKERLKYETIANNCEQAKNKYFYPCFKEEFADYLDKVSITGVSIGLKLAFNFLEQDQERTTAFKNEIIKNLHYSINYLELNNMAIDNSYRRYYGYGFAYPGYISKLEDNFRNAYEFSENIVHGLRGREGIASVEDSESQKELTQRFENAIKHFNEVKTQSDQFVQQEKKRLLEEYKSK